MTDSRPYSESTGFAIIRLDDLCCSMKWRSLQRSAGIGK